MPSIDITRPELIWPGKYDEHGNRVENRGTALPFQIIETIKEGRATRAPGRTGDLFGFSTPQDESNWHNKLIWGDNLLVLASLLEAYGGKVDLIYIDPPFATGADFSFTAPIGESGVEIFKEQSAIEVKAYRDTWGRGLESYLQMLTDRLTLIRELLSDSGSLYIHLDDHVSHYVKAIADEVFGRDSFINEIVWQRTNAHNMKMRYYPRVHDIILFYSKSGSYTWNPPFGEFSPEQLKRYKPDEEGRLYTGQDLTVSSKSQTRRDTWRGVTPPPGRSWASSLEERERLWDEGLILVKTDGAPRLDGYKVYLDEKLGRKVSSLWTDIGRVGNTSNERLDYVTQKPESLLERIITTSTKEGALVADFFSGSGTTAAVAEKLGRRWIACDLGRFAIHTTRKRLLDIPDCKPFEVLNLGRYERAYWQGVTFGETPTEPNQAAIAAYIGFILELYKAQPLAGAHLHGKKGKALIHVGAVDAPVTINQVNEALAECATLGQKELHILGWEWEMGMNDPIVKHAQAEYGIGLRLLNIPREVMEKRAVECGDIRFFDLAYLKADVVADPKAKRTIWVELKDFVIPDTDLIPDEVRAKISKWSDYIDYWAVDWDFRHDTFMNQWQTYRTRTQRKLDLASDTHTFEAPGTYRILIKVVDIFGNDTNRLLEWEVK
jgi:DNA modification methylase